MVSEDVFGELVPLGEGPAAAVWAGVREGTGDGFALKVYSGRVDRRTRARLGAELDDLGALRGHASVLVAAAIEDLTDGRLALRMDMCAQSLTELVSSFGPLSVPDAVELGVSLALALDAAHRAGIVHSGVTPGNVLFRASGAAALSDFGLTLRQTFPPDPERVVGELPPETFGDGSADERSDLYGLGAVLYFALTGAAPHAGPPGEPEGRRVLRVISDTPAPPLDRPDLPAGLAELISALLAKNPDARPLDAATVAARLGALADPAPPAPDAAFDDFGAAPALGVPILEFGPDDRPKRQLRPGYVVAAVAALVVLAVGVVLLMMMAGPEELAVPPGTPDTAAPPSATSAAPAVQVELLDPAERGDHVELTWRSSAPLEFFVVVAAEGERARTVPVDGATTHRLPVDPALRYCVWIQGANPDGIYESQRKPIRGATCTG